MEHDSNLHLMTEPAKQNGRAPVVAMPEALTSQASEPASPATEAPPPLRSVHTSNFSAILQEIFAVQVLPGLRHPDVMNDQPRLIADSFVVPEEALDLVPGLLCHPA